LRRDHPARVIGSVWRGLSDLDSRRATAIQNGEADVYRWRYPGISAPEFPLAFPFDLFCIALFLARR